MITWAQPIRPDGTVALRKTILRKPAARWDAGERNVLVGLSQFDLGDVYRKLHGYTGQGYSWVLHRKSRTVQRRFDHVFASQDLRPREATYLHDFREQGLSDHSPLEVVFGGPGEAGAMAGSSGNVR